MDIQLRAFWRSMEYAERWHSGRVLLTGATGFLGAFLLRDLLSRTNTHIFCVVRENPAMAGVDRIRATLVQYGILSPNPAKCSEELMLMETKFSNRVTAIKGDVGLMNMGMSHEDYMYMCTEIDFIIHAAAYVNLIYPYQALHGPNVLGTQNVIKFACESKIKPLHYVSTDAVFPHGQEGCREDADMAQYADALDDGYSQSKWVAEQLVRQAMDRGLPAAIYRLGNLSGESETAHWNSADFNLLMMDACLRTGYAPDVDWDVEMTPVDFVSRLIVTLTQRMALGLGKLFHVINNNTMKSRWLFEWLNARGHNIQFVPYEEWTKQVKKDAGKLKENGLVVRLIESMIKDELFFPRLSTYSNSTLMKILKVLKLTYPELNHELLKTYHQHLTRRRVLPMVRKNTMVEKPLDGKVAIVTGASSGIGAACAQQLAAAGAQVTMGARREDKLKELQQQIQREGGVAICVKCDVTDRAQVLEMVRHTETALGPVDILVNNAGIMYYEHLKNCQFDEWETQVDINCKGVLNCVGAVLQGMLARKSGHIINMSSDAGRRGFPGLAVYSGTKFFVEGLSQGMRLELAKEGIRVTCIQPGDVKTELQAHTKDSETRAQYDTSLTTEKVLVPEDIARAVVYAASQPEHVGINEILIEPREGCI